MRCFVKLSYVGTAYHGWQRQPESISVQQVVEERLGLLLGAGGPVTVVGCGRTDTGVHASEFFAHFDVPQGLELEKFSDWDEAAWKLNGMLPSDIGVSRIWQVNDSAHARFDARERTYTYWVHLRKDPFLEGRSTRVYHNLDLGKMNIAAAHLVALGDGSGVGPGGNSGDFAAFAKTGGGQKTTLCNVRTAQWTAFDGSRLRFDISADRFLRNMVRAVVGTLLEVGSGRLAVDEMPDLIASKDRCRAGTSAQACGLYLSRVDYPETAHEL